ncbi:MAG TPA: hypothetical protein VFU47_15655, partial [Armatimonadota bacterium]|nr:hypothetical protein [Armatimonadota bacterium]
EYTAKAMDLEAVCTRADELERDMELHLQDLLARALQQQALQQQPLQQYPPEPQPTAGLPAPALAGAEPEPARGPESASLAAAPDRVAPAASHPQRNAAPVPSAWGFVSDPHTPPHTPGTPSAQAHAAGQNRPFERTPTLPEPGSGAASRPAPGALRDRAFQEDRRVR